MEFQERLSALNVADVLFQRSYAFRLGFLRHMDTIIVYATGYNREQPLPPPAKYARKLCVEFCKMLTQWKENFGEV